MTSTSPSPPIPVHLATDALRHANDWDMLLFVVALLLAGVGGWRWAREREQE